MSTPAYLMYPGDILSSGRVAALEPLEELWYRRAIDLGWEPCGMPRDPKEFAGWVGRGCTVEGATKIIEKFYVPHRKDALMVVQPRQEIERKKILKKRRQKSEAGKRGMASRWKQRSKVDNSVITEDNIPIPIPIPKKEHREGPVFVASVLAGVRKELDLKKLSIGQERDWSNHAVLAQENEFTHGDFLECLSLLRKQKWRGSEVSPLEVTKNLSNLRKLREDAKQNGQGDRLQTAAEKLAADEEYRRTSKSSLPRMPVTGPADTKTLNGDRPA